MDCFSSHSLDATLFLGRNHFQVSETLSRSWSLRVSFRNSVVPCISQGTGQWMGTAGWTPWTSGWEWKCWTKMGLGLIQQGYFYILTFRCWLPRCHLCPIFIVKGKPHFKCNRDLKVQPFSGKADGGRVSGREQGGSRKERDFAWVSKGQMEQLGRVYPMDWKISIPAVDNCPRCWTCKGYYLLSFAIFPSPVIALAHARQKPCAMGRLH